MLQNGSSSILFHLSLFSRVSFRTSSVSYAFLPAPFVKYLFFPLISCGCSFFPFRFFGAKPFSFFGESTVPTPQFFNFPSPFEGRRSSISIA